MVWDVFAVGGVCVCMTLYDNGLQRVTMCVGWLGVLVCWCVWLYDIGLQWMTLYDVV